MLSEAGTKAAIKSAPASGKKYLELKDGGERGTGRLGLSIKVYKNRVTAEWYVIYYRGQKRVKLKIGSYPTISLADARKLFREEYAPTISAGR